MSAVVLAVLHAAAALLGSALADQFQERTFAYKSADDASRTVAYRLLAPPRLLPGEKYPLVIFLHGKGNRGNDNTSQLAVFPDWMASAEIRKKYPCFLLAPQCPGDRDWSARWWDKRQPPPSDPDEPLVQVVGMMDEIIKTKPIDQHRVYLTGLSMGGFGSWELAARFPERFAAVAPLCGGGNKNNADRLANLPIWCFHGDKDDQVPVQFSRDMIDAIKKAGGHPKYTELPGVGHDCWNTAYKPASGLIQWMFVQRRP